jgi:outer membrane receptor protein involved in Fe transport
VASFYQHDLHMTYDLPITEARIQLQLSIENIFNSDPSLARLEYSYDPFIGNPLGSTVRFGIRSAF